MGSQRQEKRIPKWASASTIILCAFIAFTAAAAARTGGCYATCVTPAQKQQARHAITTTFRQYARQALAVARCESGLSVRAYNGQYLGLFQMGSFARSRYGHGPGAWQQARAAYQYFVDSGKDWSPWSCRP